MAQVTVTNPTNTTPNLAATYTSLANAITALNTITAISGPVIITLNAGNPQTAPSGGYIINFTATTSAANNVTIAGSNNTITAFTPQPTGSVIDAIFKIQGANFVTIRNFTMQENPANTTTGGATPTNLTTGNNMTEWGVALLYRNNTDGAQNNTIQNNNISLNRTYTNTYGIYSSVRHSPTAPTVTADIVNATTAPNSGNKIYGNNISNVNMGITMVGSAVAAQMDIGNDVGGTSAATGNIITNWGSTGPAITVNINSSGTYHGIFMNHQVSDNVSYNTITSAVLNGTTADIHAIYKRYASGAPSGTFTSTINNNTITVTNNLTGTSDFRLIFTSGITTASVATLNINNNALLNSSVGAAGSSTSIIGISNTSIASVLNVNSNTIRGCTSTATGGGFTGISNTASVYTTININNNNIGSAAGNAFSFSAATSGAINGISCATVSPTASVSISNNNFQGFVNTVAGSGIHTYISLTHSPSGASTNNINNNTFTNLVSNTTGNVTLINRSGIMALNAGHTENCNNNSIVTAFSKPSGTGLFIGYNSSSGSFAGNTINQEFNNFSNITIAGGIVNIWSNAEGGATIPVKNINNNTFSNITYTGTTNINILTCSRPGGISSISGNTINNVTASGLLACISVTGTIAATTLNVLNNTVTNCSSTIGVSGIRASSTSITTLNVNNNTVGDLYTTSPNLGGILFSGGITVNAFKNKVYNLQADDAGAQVFGISVAVLSTGNYNIHNNYIGDLRAPNANLTLAIQGLSILPNTSSTSHTVYYNTIYLNASSIGTDFGTTGIYLLASSSSTTCNTTLRNNIIVNTSTPNGAGLTTALRRTNTTLNNFNSSSNNNIFYAGTPAANRLIYYDAFNSDQTLTAYKARVTPRDAASFTELPPFISITGTDANYLHLNPLVPTQAESGAVNITGITDDYDNDIRQGNTGYAGTGTAPDIGADELEGIFTELNPPVISYTTISTPTCTYTNITITGVTITDVTGIPLSGANRPRIYYRRNSGSWFSQPGTNTAGTATNSTWSFTIVAADMGALTGGDVISYYIIAQDNITTPNVSSNPSAGLVATNVNTVTTAPTSPNTYTLNYNLSGTYTVGIGGNFTTLTAAVTAYNNACSLAGPSVFEMIDDTYPSETFPITINNHADASAVNTLTIRPSASATPVITGAINTQLLSLNGARFITLDGRQGGSGTPKSFSFINNNTSGNTLLFINDAVNNTVKNCIVRGSSNSATRGVIHFSTASAGGNDNNTIDNNDIADGAATPANAIYSSGTAGNQNSNITISNNHIFNFFHASSRSVGIYANTNSTGWTVTGNRLFQTVDRLYTGACDIYGMWFNDGNGYTISNNVVGYANASGTGTMTMVGNATPIAGFPTSYTAGTGVAIRFIGIVGNFATGNPASGIHGNTVSGIAMFTSSTGFVTYGTLCGIYVEAGNVNIGTVAGNTIGAASGTGAIYLASNSALVVQGKVVGIRAGSTGTINVQNNIIGAISASGTNSTQVNSITGISTGGAGTFSITSNTIGNSTPENLKVGYFTTAGNLSVNGSPTTTTGTTLPFIGIEASTSAGDVSITGNTIQGFGIYGLACPGSGIQVSTSGLFSGPNVSVQTNTIGTVAAGWVHFGLNHGSSFSGISIIKGTTLLPATYTITDNTFRGITASPSVTHGSTLMISMIGSGSDNVNITGNTFSNLVTNAGVGLIGSSYNITGPGFQNISNNSIVGGLTINGNGGFLGISTGSGSSNAVMIHSNNNFSNITLTGNGDMVGMECLYASGSPTRTVTGNILTNWQTNGFVNMIAYDAFGGALSTISNNTIQQISAGNALIAIQLGDLSLGRDGSATLLQVSNNEISNLSTNSGNLYGIINYVPSTVVSIENNLIHDFSGGASNVTGISHSTVNFLDARVIKNKIYNLSSTNATARVTGIESEQTNPVCFNTIANNFVGNLFASNSGIVNNPSVRGINVLADGNVYIYYNTVSLNASSSSANFSSAALFTQSGPRVHLQNNILSNTSTAGASGKTVAFWNLNSLANYNALSNYNDFYAGTPSASNLIYFDGTNSDQTIVAYKTRVTPKDNASISELPAFISTTGSDVNFLHLSTAANCAFASLGRNTGLSINITDDFDGDSRMTISPFFTDIGADEAFKANVWTGAINNNWNNAGNWSEAVVPNSATSKVIISNPPAAQPLIGTGETFQVGSLSVTSGAVLNNRGTLQVSGFLSAPANGINNLNAGIAAGSIEMNGNCVSAPTLAGNIFVNNTVNDLIVGKDLSISSVTGEGLNIGGALLFGTVTGKVLNTGNNITLVSLATGTARVGDLTGNSISGEVTVERYINTGVGGGRHAKTWQFLATPAKGQSIFDAWQEGGATPAGYGTILTGTGTGFDITTALPSMKFFDPTIGTSGNWAGITNTAAQLNDKRGYMVFVRGDRTVNTLASAPNPTNLRSKGTLYQPSDPPPVTNVLAGKPATVGNPYASAIDLEYLKDNGLMVNLNNDAVVWDPLLFGSYGLGGYQTLSAANNYEPTAGGTAFYPTGVPAPDIQSGQAFFVQSAGPAGTISFTEASKVSANRLVNRFTNRPTDKQYFRARLFTNTNMIADGNAAVFSVNYRDRLDADDAIKLQNSGENFFISRNNKQLSVESRSRVQRTDTIFYQLSNLRKQPYKFRFEPVNMNDGRLEAILVDQYLHTQTAIGLYDSTLINFTVNNDPASAASDRFYVIFRKRNRQPLLITEITAQSNDDLSKQVIWKVTNESMVEQYSIERSFNGNSFETIATETGVTNNEVIALYRFTDKEKNDKTVYYRIKAKQTDGQIIYSDIAIVKSPIATVGIYPNPVVDNIIRLQFSGMPAGSYDCKILNQNGQEIVQTEIQVTTNESKNQVRLASDLPAGTYFLRLSHPSEKTRTLKFIVNK